MIKKFEGGLIFTGDDIALYRVIALHKALKLEIVGLRMSRGPSAYSILKKEYGLKGNKQSVYDQVEVILDDVRRMRQATAVEGTSL